MAEASLLLFWSLERGFGRARTELILEEAEIPTACCTIGVLVPESIDYA